MVLGRAFLIVAVAGCSQSLFDSHGGTGSATGDGAVPATCQAPCAGDAATEFDGTPNGSTGNWRYLDDHRDRTWAAMTADGSTTMTGADPANTISTCASHNNAGACQDLPNALLVSSSGSTSTADPAVELTVTVSQVVQISVLARVGDGAPSQTIRLYRNSREDVLFTGTASAGTTLENAITLDAIAGDRFLVAVAPTTGGASEVALQMFVSSTGANFPSQCQFAVPFSSTTGNTVTNVCGGEITHNDATGTPAPPVLGAGPFTEAGMAANLAIGTYYNANAVLDKTHDVTVQLWLEPGTIGADAQWGFSDQDLDLGGGVGVVFYNDTDTVLKMEVSTCSSPSPLAFDGDKTPFPADGKWHFVRVVHTGGNVLVCLDGKRAFSFPLAEGLLKSSYPPYIGKNVIWTPAGAFYGGGIDDVRVFSAALPCQ